MIGLRDQLRKHTALVALTAISVVSDPIWSMFAVFICGFSSYRSSSPMPSPHSWVQRHTPRTQATGLEQWAHCAIRRFIGRSFISWRACGAVLVPDQDHRDSAPSTCNVGHHDNAAVLGCRDQEFHGNLPMLALRRCGRQRHDENAGIAQASKFTAIAGRNHIKKWRDQPACPPSTPCKLFTGFSKKSTVRSLPLTAKSSEWAFRPEEYACRSR